MKVLRAIQILNKDGMQTISSTYNEVDDQGNIIKLNVKDVEKVLEDVIII